MAAKETCFTDPSNYVNRELSWLEFDHRVLGEARDKTVSYTHLDVYKRQAGGWGWYSRRPSRFRFPFIKI